MLSLVPLWVWGCLEGPGTIVARALGRVAAKMMTPKALTASLAAVAESTIPQARLSSARTGTALGSAPAPLATGMYFLAGYSILRPLPEPRFRAASLCRRVQSHGRS